MSDPIYGIEPSEFDKRLCIKCVTYATRDSIYISKETFFPMQLLSGGILSHFICLFNNFIQWALTIFTSFPKSTPLPYPNNFVSSFYSLIKSNLCCIYIHGHVGFHWSMVDLPVATLLKNTDSLCWQIVMSAWHRLDSFVKRKHQLGKCTFADMVVYAFSPKAFWKLVSKNKQNVYDLSTQKPEARDSWVQRQILDTQWALEHPKETYLENQKF